MNEANSYVNTGASLAEPATLTFADGERTVPEWIVGHLGGPQRLQESAAQFARITYAEFLKAFDQAAARQHLNQLGSQFVRRALKGR